MDKRALRRKAIAVMVSISNEIGLTNDGSSQRPFEEECRDSRGENSQRGEIREEDQQSSAHLRGTA
jgi:hypothetical protein